MPCPNPPKFPSEPEKWLKTQETDGAEPENPEPPRASPLSPKLGEWRPPAAFEIVHIIESSILSRGPVITQPKPQQISELTRELTENKGNRARRTRELDQPTNRPRCQQLMGFYTMATRESRANRPNGRADASRLGARITRVSSAPPAGLLIDQIVFEKAPWAMDRLGGGAAVVSTEEEARG
jgi:hypothetical protein